MSSSKARGSWPVAWDCSASPRNYNYKRYYDPETGRYISVDPARSDNTGYSYAENNPAIYIDPIGDIPFLAAAYVIIQAAGVAYSLYDLALFIDEQYNLVQSGDICADQAIRNVGTRIGIDLAITAAGVGLAKALKSAFSVATPWGRAWQEWSLRALRARKRVLDGAKVSRIGTAGVSEGIDAQFWSLENPWVVGFEEFGKRYGIPKKNLTRANFTETAIYRKGSVVTRTAPPAGGNPGGGIEAVFDSGGVSGQSFNFFGDL